MTREERIAVRVAQKAAHEADIANRIVRRDPCFGCGVPAHKHGDQGCKQWRGLA